MLSRTESEISSQPFLKVRAMLGKTIFYFFFTIGAPVYVFFEAFSNRIQKKLAILLQTFTPCCTRQRKQLSQHVIMCLDFNTEQSPLTERIAFTVNSDRSKVT